MEVGEECIIGALCFVPAGEKIPRRSVVVGNPAKVVKQVSDEMLAWKTKGTALYQQLPQAMQQGWKPCEPLSQVEPGGPKQGALYQTWKQEQQENKTL